MARLARIPDLLTTANLACGVGSILLASQGQLTWACWLVFAGALFDVFDGLAARALGGGTPLGAQLDSLADMVTFGVAPAFIVFSLPSWPSTLVMVEALREDTRTVVCFDPYFGHVHFVPSLVIAIASAWRLAKFNLDTRQTIGFLGLPTPANGLFWASIPLCIGTGLINRGFGYEAIQSALIALAFPMAATFASLILGALMLSELPLPSLKFKHFKWKGNEVMFLLLGIGLVLVVLYGVLAVPLILVLYLLSPLWGRVFGKVEPSVK